MEIYISYYGVNSNSWTSRLKQKYRDFNKNLGQTGAGLLPEEIEEDTELGNLVGKLHLNC